jgi:hypothetical protein
MYGQYRLESPRLTTAEDFLSEVKMMTLSNMEMQQEIIAKNNIWDTQFFCFSDGVWMTQSMLLERSWCKMIPQEFVEELCVKHVLSPNVLICKLSFSFFEENFLENPIKKLKSSLNSSSDCSPSSSLPSNTK